MSEKDKKKVHLRVFSMKRNQHLGIKLKWKKELGKLKNYYNIYDLRSSSEQKTLRKKGKGQLRR